MTSLGVMLNQGINMKDINEENRHVKQVSVMGLRRMYAKVKRHERACSLFFNFIILGDKNVCVELAL